MESLEENFEFIKAIPPSLHLCCPKVAEIDDTDYADPEAPSEISPEEVRQRINDGKERLEKLYSCSVVFGLPKEDRWQPHKDLFVAKANRWLRSCPDCIKSWHKGRSQFLKRLSEYEGCNPAKATSRILIYIFAF